MKRNIVEWAVLGVSIVAIVALVAVLLAESVAPARPPEPVIRLQPAAARASEAGWIVPATVVNAGNQPAEAVFVEASATVAGNAETSQLEVNYLPAGTTIELAFAFSAQPDGDVTVRLVGFRIP
ncbi:MAG TPA: hypothetical protein VNW68_01880 [Candidatus Limnocylindria bacterium]|nr:hypothetical protein [Candidatus Limnocylindria bacterium]